MNKFLRRLTEIASAESRIIIGLMSGTSLDGLDIALCNLSGSGLNTKAEIAHFETYAYPEELKEEVRKVFSKREVDLELLTLLNAYIGSLHANLVLQALEKWNVDTERVDCIASHGQTIYHAPERLHGRKNYPNATLQIGDSDHIAVKTGIITLSDFRQKHLAAGGEGAPLALYGDCILFSDKEESRILLNIGGISNFTYLPADNSDRILCTDVGPGNTLIDNLAKKHFNLPYDEGGKIALKGNIIPALLEQLLSHSFFREPFPKSTGPELFNLDFLEKAVKDAGITGILPEDLISTVSEFTAKAISIGIKAITKDMPFGLYVSGGGSHNHYLQDRLQQHLPMAKIKAIETLGLNPDAKEALLFAILANETICGSAIETGAGPRVMMGKISLPG